MFEKRQREAAAAHVASQLAKATPAAVIQCEVNAYLAQPLIVDFENKFDLLAYWKDKAVDKFDNTTTPPTLLVKAEFPLLARLARKYLCVDATSCEAERVFSCLALTLDHLRCSLHPAKVEKMMFLRLNNRLIPEFASLHASNAARAAQLARTAADIDRVQSHLAAAVHAAVPVVASAAPASTTLSLTATLDMTASP